MTLPPDPEFRAQSKENPDKSDAIWQIAAAKQVGRSHIYLNRGCEDDFAHTEAPGRVLIAVVSDGAGSVPFAAEGAQTICKTILQAATEFCQGRGDPSRPLTPELDRTMILAWIEQARAALEVKATATRSPLNHYAATLLLACIGPHDAVIAQIGDGATVIATDNHQTEWQYVHWPQHGDFLNTTYFVTESDYAEHLLIAAPPSPITAVAMFSDGLERLLLSEQNRAAHSPFFTKIFAQFRQCLRQTALPAQDHARSDMTKIIADLLDSREVNDRTDDDKTLLLAMREDK
ncbi:MAG: PP2C family serine/threonine-protein phosphatase [Alphaproteobacteria bacterium]|nr:PP2C family serine/threonine-protein phosphatase [Alphaproteobacteria bacterium]